MISIYLLLDYLDAFLVVIQDAQYVFVYGICQLSCYLSWHSGAFR